VQRAYRILPAAILFRVPVFAIFWHELRWYHTAAAALYLVNYDFSHPCFLGHLWSLSVQEQFYFLWPGVLGKWHQHRVWIAVGAIAGHFLGLHGRADETFPAVADILAIGCLLAVFSKRMPKIKAGRCCPSFWFLSIWACYGFTSRLLCCVLWPVMHFSIAGLLLHVVQRPYWIPNFGPVVWLGKISYGLYRWQQLFAFGEHPRPWYFPLLAVVAASASYYLWSNR
jgi:peptidoglycan/LPS O-acetylase OafA/YrhL